MRRPRRKWGGTATGAALFLVFSAAWAFSLYGYVGWIAGNARCTLTFELGAGAALIGVRLDGRKGDPAWSVTRIDDRSRGLGDEGTRLWFGRETLVVESPYSAKVVRPFVVPLWTAAALSGVTALRLWRRGRRFAAPYCPACGYDLRGAPPGPCPECGTKPSLPSAPSSSAGEGGAGG